MKTTGVRSLTWTRPRPAAAQLVLEDGRVFRGRAFGAPRDALGEVCFNTGMCGYQEVLTDPSYAGQIVVMTAPQMGNYGINPYDEESERPQVAGFVVRNLSQPHNWRSAESLHDYLTRHGIPGLYEVDTRAVTLWLREKGARRGVLAPVERSVDELRQAACSFPRFDEMDLARAVSCHQIYTMEPQATPREGADLRQSTYQAGPEQAVRGDGLHLLAYDFGIKRNILERLMARGCRVTVVPASTPADVVLDQRPHGVLLSNGPGDPRAVGYCIEAVRELAGRLPVFGICLGHQILALALGARSYKLKFGHRGVNHPVHDRRTGKVRITSQNHGYAIDPDSLSRAGVDITEVSLNDGTVEAMEHRSRPVFSVQYHPEASPGPHDNDPHFDHFLKLAASEAGIELPPTVPATREVGGGNHAAA